MENEIKFVVFDFDGVFSDGKIFFSQSGMAHKSYNGKDAWSLKLLKKENIKSGIISLDKIISLKQAPHIFDRLDKCSLGEDAPKIEVLKRWLEEYNLSYSAVAYIGDDIADISVLEKVGFSACPSDAIDSVKNVCKYVCSKTGGNGAVREFVDLIIDNNKKLSLKNSNQLQVNKYNNDGEITVVIPVKEGSTRCKDKNIRKFGDTNLLKLKIETLKKVKGIHRILVTSNSDNMLALAKSMGVDVHKREEKYCGECPPSELFPYLASLISSPILMYVQVTTPFISHTAYNRIIREWHTHKNDYDSLVTSHGIQEFIWDESGPVNYDVRKHPMSQNLPKYNVLNFACHLINVETVKKYNNIIGLNPYFYNLSDIENIDIDYNNEFLVSELLYNNNITDAETCENIMIHRNESGSLELLDCTIRDGGYLNEWNFSDEEVLDCYKAATDAGYTYFEIGFKRKKPENPTIKSKWYYCLDEDVNEVVSKLKGCKIAVLVEFLKGDIDISDFVEKKKSNISLVRVLTKLSYPQEELKKFCKELINYGYEVALNIIASDTIDDIEINKVTKDFHDVELKALYLADSYGGFNESNLPIQLHKFYREFKKYNKKLQFGFHCHNNNEDALSKTSIAINHGCTMIDTTIGGMGRGAGNLKSEQLLTYLLRDNPKSYINKITPLILYFNKHILSKHNYVENLSIQSHPYYMVSSALSLHPNYIDEILNDVSSSVEDDIKLIVKLDEYTKKENRRNYDKNLIKKLK